MKKSWQIFVALVLLLLSTSLVSASALTDLGFKEAGSYDLGGNTVTIISWTSERMANYFDSYPPVLDRIAEAERLFNCKIEFMQTREIPEVNLNRLLAGESTYDLWHVQNKIGYWELVAGGAAYPVTQFLAADYYDILPPSFIATEEALKFDGQYWGLGPVEYRPMYGYQNDLLFVAYNKTLFEREGLPDLYELYLDGEWTWEKATEIAVKATVDFDGDGVIDQWGIVDARPWDLAVANGANMIKIDSNGRMVFNGDDPKYIEALEQSYQWWTELGVQFQSYSSGEINNTFRNGKAAMHFSTPAFGLPDLLAEMTDDWGIVPLPMGPSADKHYWTVQALNTTLIPINAKQPEALAALRAFLWQEDDISVNDFLATHVNSQEMADVLLTANFEWDGSASRVFEKYLGDFAQYTRDVQSGEKSASAAMAEIKPIIQNNLDNLLNQ